MLPVVVAGESTSEFFRQIRQDASLSPASMNALRNVKPPVSECAT